MTRTKRPRRRDLVVALLGTVDVAGMALLVGATRVADLILSRTRNDRLPFAHLRRYLQMLFTQPKATEKTR